MLWDGSSIYSLRMHDDLVGIYDVTFRTDDPERPAHYRVDIRYVHSITPAQRVGPQLPEQPLNIALQRVCRRP